MDVEKLEPHEGYTCILNALISAAFKIGNVSHLDRLDIQSDYLFGRTQVALHDLEKFVRYYKEDSTYVKQRLTEAFGSGMHFDEFRMQIDKETLEHLKRLYEEISSDESHPLGKYLSSSKIEIDTLTPAEIHKIYKGDSRAQILISGHKKEIKEDSYTLLPGSGKVSHIAHLLLRDDQFQTGLEMVKNVILEEDQMYNVLVFTPTD